MCVCALAMYVISFFFIFSFHYSKINPNRSNYIAHVNVVMYKSGLNMQNTHFLFLYQKPFIFYFFLHFFKMSVSITNASKLKRTLVSCGGRIKMYHLIQIDWMMLVIDWKFFSFFFIRLNYSDPENL